jgi:hypothetical protein
MLHPIQHFLTTSRAAASVAALVCGSVAPALRGQEAAKPGPSVSPPPAGSAREDSGIEAPAKSAKNVSQIEQQLAMETALKKVKELQSEIEDLRKRSHQLSENLATASKESDESKEKYNRMRLQLEALGISALSGDERSLQLRLLNAVNDYRLAEKDKKTLAEQLVQLSDASMAHLKEPTETSRKRLEQALAQASVALQGGGKNESQPAAVPLESAKVVSVKKDLGLAVINAGKETGVRLGMPMKFVRASREIASGVVVDCRDRITGVLVTIVHAEGDSVSIGDTVKLEPTTNANAPKQKE